MTEKKIAFQSGMSAFLTHCEHFNFNTMSTWETINNNSFNLSVSQSFLPLTYIYPSELFFMCSLAHAAQTTTV